MKLAASRRAPLWLGVIAFCESAFFPIPPDVMLWPMVLARPARAYLYAGLCTLCSVFGGMLGYAIGYFLAPFAQQLLAFFGAPHALEAFQRQYAHWGVWVILVQGLTPIPYKLVTIASGQAHFLFPVFVAASIATRGMRYFLSAAVLKRFGPRILPVIERRLMLVSGIVVVVAVIAIVLLKVLG